MTARDFSGTIARVLIAILAAVIIFTLLAACYAVLALLLLFIYTWAAQSFGWPPMPFIVAFGIVIFLSVIFGGGAKASCRIRS